MATAPPESDATFVVIVQSVAVKVESTAQTAPPKPAVFAVIVQSVAVTVESSSA